MAVWIGNLMKARVNCDPKWLGGGESVKNIHVGPGWVFPSPSIIPSISINGHATGTDWLEVPIPYMLGLFLRPNFQGISPQNMAKNMVLAYLHFRILKFPLIPVTIEGDVISNGCFRTVLTSFWVDYLPFYRGCNHQPPTIYQLQLGWCTWYPDLDPEHHTLPGKSFLRPRWIVRRLLAWCVQFFCAAVSSFELWNQSLN